MKTLFLLSTLFPAGLLAAWVGSNAAVQDETPTAAVQGGRQIRVVQTVTSPSTPSAVMIRSAPAAISVTAPAAVTLAQEGIPAMAPVSGVQIPMTAQSPRAFAFTTAFSGFSDRTHKAIAKLHSAKSDEEKAEARSNLKTALGEEFDEYLEHQSKELDRLEEKFSKLRKQWEKRKEAKDELVSLRLQMLENEANGLGWPSGGSEGFSWRTNVGPFSATEPSLYTIPPMEEFAEASPELEESESADDDSDDDEDSQPEPAPTPRSKRHAR